MSISITLILAVILGLLSLIIPDLIIPAIILAAIPFLQSYFVKPNKDTTKTTTASSATASSFINKEVLKQTVLKSNSNTNNSNNNNNTKWGSIWKWSKSKSNNNNTNNSNIKLTNKKSNNINNDQDSTWGIPTLRLRDHNGDIIPINPNTAVPIETQYFKGEILFMLKCEGQLSSYNKYRSYFSSKAGNDGRKFEIQIQGQFKYNPKGILYVGGEVEGPVRLFQNVVGRIASMLLNLIVRFYPYTHFSYGDDYSPNGLFERAHLSFPLTQVADKFISTRLMPGNPPPDLGTEIIENDIDRAKRRSRALKNKSASKQNKKDKGLYSQFNTNNINEVIDPTSIQKGMTYTFSLQSTYLDFSSWNVCNIPGSRPVSIGAFIGKRPLHIVLYEQDNQKHMINLATGLIPHYMRSKKYILELELSHIGIMGNQDVNLGPNKESNATNSNDDFSSVKPFSGSKDDLNKVPSSSNLFHTMYGNDYDEQVGVGDMGVPSNEDVPLIVLPAPWETKGALQQTCYTGPNKSSWLWSKPNRGRKSMKRLIEAEKDEKDVLHAASDMTASVQCLDDIGGYAARTVCNDVKTMKFIKVEVSDDIYFDDDEFQSTDVDDESNDEIDSKPIIFNKKKISHATPSFVQSEDSSILRCGDTVRIMSSETGSCLEATRGQYLTLYKKLEPSINGVFQITILDDKGKILHGTPLTRGKTFRLRSVRYSNYEVGCVVNDPRDPDVGSNGSYKLVLYEWNSKRLMNESVKWDRHGAQVNPLYLCVIGDSMRSFNEMTPVQEVSEAASKTKSTKIYQKLKEDSINPDIDPFYSYSIEITGWVHILHRQTLKRTLAFIVVSNFEREEGIQAKWTSLRTALELDGMLNNAEEIAGCGKFKGNVEETIDGNDDELSQYEHESHLNRPIPLPHELPIEQSLRLFRHRLYRVIETLQNGNSIFSSDNDDMRKIEMIQRAFLKFLIKPRILDSWFLLPGMDQSSIVASVTSDANSNSPGKKLKSPTKLVSTPKIFTVPVARALWDDHWQEEIMTVLKGVVIFRPPSCITTLTSPLQQLVLHLGDVKNVVEIPFEDSPLPGLYLLRLETVDRVHYLCFSGKDVLNTALTTLLEHMSDLHYSSRSMEQAIEVAAETLVSSGKSDGIAGNVLASSIKNFDKEPHLSILSGRWMPTKYGPRFVLNSRRSYFDKISSSLVVDDHDRYDDDNEPYYLKISIKLLKEVFDLCRLNSNSDSNYQNDDINNDDNYDNTMNKSKSYDNDDNFNYNPNFDAPMFGHLDNISMDQLTSFLDNTVDLKQINLDDIDFDSTEALCFFVNVYHVLLLHARLVLETPNKATWAAYYNRACYEIGDDVFSLAEIEHCVIRGGSLSRYEQKKIKAISRHAAQPPSENDSHYAYALGISDKRANFLLNSGSISHPHIIYLLTSNTFDMQLDKATHSMIINGMRVDLYRRELILPKVCKVYLNDDEEIEPEYDEDGYEIKISDAEKLARRCLQLIEHCQDTYSEDLFKLLNENNNNNNNYDDNDDNDNDDDDNNNNTNNRRLKLKFLKYQYQIHDVITLSI